MEVNLQYRKLFFFLLTTSLTSLGQDFSDDPQARSIMELVDNQQLAINDSTFMKLKLSSCTFGIQNKKISCTERPRVKVLESISTNYGESNRDNKTVTFTLQPLSERGIGMLSFSYDDKGKDNQTWLYLSALGKVKRIAGGNEETSEPASLFGSEFTTEDTDTGKLSEYTFRILSETKINDRLVWQIESTPNKSRKARTRYARTVSYVDKTRYVILRSEMYDKYGNEIKRLIGSRVEQVNNVWLTRSMTMMNLVTNRLSNMAFLNINNGIIVSEYFFTKRSLEDAAFREAHLTNIRDQI